MLFFIEAQKKVAEAEEQNIENGQVIKIRDTVITPPNSNKNTPTKRGRGRKGRR